MTFVARNSFSPRRFNCCLRNRQLEDPHFIRFHLFVQNMRDRLNALRGRGIGRSMIVYILAFNVLYGSSPSTLFGVHPLADSTLP
ncbi:hypothetical protein S83_004766 [Arachis hypogaea]